MQYKKICRAVALLVLVALFAATTVYYTNRQSSICMGITVLDDKQTAQYIHYARTDLSDNIFFNKIPAAIDTQTDTIYIYQKINADTKHYQLKGRLNCDDENIKLYFAADEKLSDLKNAVKDNHNFKLIADLGNGEYMQYDVVFTTLPVLNMNGEVVGKKFVKINPDETGERDVFEGTVSVWDNNYSKTNTYSTQSGIAQWNQRGNSTFWFDKKSWKISFKDKDGNNKNYDFLGIEPDDDWILNAMVRDDVKLREKTVLDLWDTLYRQTDYNHPMSKGKYVEVINNGEYAGVYLLQRRIDAKYLGLDNDVQLIKGEKDDRGYTFVSGTQPQKALVFMQQFQAGENMQYLNVDNWIDNSLFTDAFYMADNAGRYNTFYVIEDIDTRPKLSIAMWDNDFSFGINYRGTFVYDISGAASVRRNRNELYQLAQIHPDLYDKMSARWAQLRGGVLASENIIAVIQNNQAALDDSGAYIREKEKNGLQYGGDDTVQNMISYVIQRMEYLDRCYDDGDIVRKTGEQPPQ